MWSRLGKQQHPEEPWRSPAWRAAALEGELGVISCGTCGSAIGVPAERLVAALVTVEQADLKLDGLARLAQVPALRECLDGKAQRNR